MEGAGHSNSLHAISQGGGVMTQREEKHLEECALFSADHHGFYRGGESFFPLIQENALASTEWANIVRIVLPARLQDDLDWRKPLELAKRYIQSSKHILWEIDLGLNHYLFDLKDTAAFFSFTVALEEFTKKVWPEFSPHTFGVVLYHGVFQPAVSFPLSKWETLYLEWLEDKPNEDAYSLFCAQNLADYLHRLISFLPDTLLAFAIVDVSMIQSSAKIAQLFSNMRFEHSHLILRGASFPFCGIVGSDSQWDEPKGMIHGWLGAAPLERPRETVSAPLAIFLPQDALIDTSVLQEIDQLIDFLGKARKPFRIISEEKLTQQWDGLDHIIVIPRTISLPGKRKLQGFIAAGGTVVTPDSLVDLFDRV